MTLRKKIFFIVAYTLEAAMILLYAGISFFFLGNLVENEEANVKRNVEWVGRAIRQDIADLDRQLLDWSQWDDMYAFSNAPTEAFVDSNFPLQTIDNLDLSFMLVLDRDGKVIASRGMDLKTRAEISVPAEIESQLKPGNILSSFESPSDGHKGLILFSTGPAFIVTRPITTSLGEGPPRGTVAFVRFFDDKYHRSLSDFLGYPLTFSIYGSNAFSSDFSEAAKRLKTPEDVRTIAGDRSVSGYGFAPDVFGSPLLFYKLEKPIPTSFGTSKLVALLSLLGFLLVSTLVIFFLLHWTVLARVNYLSGVLSKAKREGLSKEGIEFFGTDEIAALAGEINELLAALLKTRKEGDVAERRFETIADTIPAFLWMLGRKRQCLYVNKRVSQCTGSSDSAAFNEEWMKHIHPDDANECLTHCADAFERRKPVTMEYRVRCASGDDYRWILDNGVPYSTSDGVFLGFLHVAVDITDRKGTEEAEKTKRREAERLNAIMVSRELRMIELKKEIRECRSKLEKES